MEEQCPSKALVRSSNLFGGTKFIIMAIIRREDIFDMKIFDSFNAINHLKFAYGGPVIHDPSRHISLLPNISEVNLPITKQLTKLRYEGCPGCGASRIKEGECEYCGRKH